MTIRPGDLLLMDHPGGRRLVEALTGVRGGRVSVRDGRSVSDRPAHCLHEPWVLAVTAGSGDPTDGGGAVYARPDGGATGDIGEAELFATPAEVEAFRGRHPGVRGFDLLRARDCLGA